MDNSTLYMLAIVPEIKAALLLLAVGSLIACFNVPTKFIKTTAAMGLLAGVMGLLLPTPSGLYSAQLLSAMCGR